MGQDRSTLLGRKDRISLDSQKSQESYVGKEPLGKGSKVPQTGLFLGPLAEKEKKLIQQGAEKVLKVAVSC